MFNSLSNKTNVLNSKSIIIWQYPLNNLFNGAFNLLSADEQQRANNFYFKKHQRRFIVSHAMLRIILAQYAKIAPKNLSFSSHKNGKPFLIDFPNIQFNLSHSGEAALVAISKDSPLGIDLEFFKKSSFAGIAKQMFSARENNILNNSSFSIKPMVFFKIWTQKEAVIKADGIGMNSFTKNFEVPVFTNEKNCELVAYDNNWIVQSFTPFVASQAALCYKPGIENIYYKALKQSHLHAAIIS